MSADQHNSPNALLRQLPQVEAVLQSPLLTPALARWRRDVLLRLIRQEIEELRESLLASAAKSKATPPGLLSADGTAQQVLKRLAGLEALPLRPVINATGVLLHTNLGRSVLSPGAREALARIAGGYCNLEMDLPSGRRSRRDVTLEPLLTSLTGCEAATVVNNCAAAVYLVLYTLARGKEVITSRGELVEIGGSYRVPEVVRAGGCRLVEVGSTNKTRLADYEAAIGPKTALLLKTHPSNYRISGFTEEASVEELTALSRRSGIPLLVDLGSGLIPIETSGADGSVRQTRGGGSLPQSADRRLEAAPTSVDSRASGETSVAAVTLNEPDVLGTLAPGPDLVCFSGDKLLGGPQAGIICGSRAMVEKLRRSAMWRALRVDKFTAAALAATLLERLHGEPPQWQAQAGRGISRLRQEADSLCALLAAARPEGSYNVVPAAGSYGGGSLPEETLDSFAVSIRLPGLSADKLDRRLRTANPPVAGYIIAGEYALNVLTLQEGEAGRIASILKGVD